MHPLKILCTTISEWVSSEMRLISLTVMALSRRRVPKPIIWDFSRNRKLTFLYETEYTRRSLYTTRENWRGFSLGSLRTFTKFHPRDLWTFPGHLSIVHKKSREKGGGGGGGGETSYCVCFSTKSEIQLQHTKSPLTFWTRKQSHYVQQSNTSFSKSKGKKHVFFSRDPLFWKLWVQ